LGRDHDDRDVADGWVSILLFKDLIAILIRKPQIKKDGGGAPFAHEL